MITSPINLRDYRDEDEPLLVEYLNNPAVTRNLSSRIPQPYTLEDARWWISEGSKAGIVRAIEVDGLFSGTVGATPGHHEHSRTAEIGYWLAEPCWGRGIATQALTGFTALLFETTDLVRLYANVYDGNTASMRVLEKSGYQLEVVQRQAGFKNDRIFDLHVYVRLKSDSACLSSHSL